MNGVSGVAAQIDGGHGGGDAKCWDIKAVQFICKTDVHLGSVSAGL